MSDYEDDITEELLGVEDDGRGINRIADMAEDLNEMLEEAAQLEADEVDDDEYDEYDEEVVDYDEEEVEETPSYYRLGDYEIPAEQVDDVVNLLQWASSLSPEQAARVNAALAGQDPPVVPQEPAPEAPVEPDTPAFIAELEQTDPTMARYMRELYEERVERERELESRIAEVMGELDTLETVTGQRILQETEAQVAETEAAVRDNFLADHGLDESDYDLLVETAGRLNITNAMVETYGLEDGFYKTLETAMYANDELRERGVRNEVQSALQEERTFSRKEAASGLAPQGGTNLPTSTPAGLPQSERRSAMIRDIEALLGMQP